LMSWRNRSAPVFLVANFALCLKILEQNISRDKGVPSPVDIILPQNWRSYTQGAGTHLSRLIPRERQNETDEEIEHNRSLRHAGTAARLSTGRSSDHGEVRDFLARRPPPPRERCGSGDRTPEHNASAHSPG